MDINKIIYGGRTLRIAIGMMFVLFLLTGCASALSNSGGGGWLNNTNIIINNTNGGVLAEYQVVVNLDSVNFQFSQAQANGEDIRFTDPSGAELNYWIENWDYSGKNAKVWVRDPNIPANAETAIQMYYGNPSASSSSDGTGTFDLFDNFDTLTWTPILDGVNTGSPTVSNSILSLPDGQYTRVSKNFVDSQNYVYTYKMRYVGNLDSYNWYMFNFKNDPPINSNIYGQGYNVAGYVESGAAANQIYIKRSDAGWLYNLAITDKSLSRNIWYVWKVIYNNGEISVLVDDIPAGSALDTTYTTGSILAFQTGKDIGVDIDYIRVRKYASPEPSVIVGVQNPVDSAGPVTCDVMASPNPESINKSITLTALSSDETTGSSAISSAEYNIDGGSFVGMSAQDGAFDEITEEVTTNIGPFAEAGVHEVCVRSTDSAGNVGDQECILLAVYDPSAGFVTGGGWINSPSGAYTPQNPNDPDLVDKATFGFVAKYQKGESIPTGSTEFQFKIADLNFHSTEYEWLVVAGTRAQYKGTGTINGVGEYGFMLTAIDGTPDRLRIKIWKKANDEIVYDNKHGQSDTGNDATELGGGSIIIHTK